MLYKTIVLELLESYPTLYTRLRMRRSLSGELSRYASDLREAHLRLKREGREDGAAREQALAEIERRIEEEAARVEA
jgi:hypothetical protein